MCIVWRWDLALGNIGTATNCVIGHGEKWLAFWDGDTSYIAFISAAGGLSTGNLPGGAGAGGLLNQRKCLDRQGAWCLSSLRGLSGCRGWGGFAGMTKSVEPCMQYVDRENISNEHNCP